MLSVLLVPMVLSGLAPATTPTSTSRAAATDPTVRVSINSSSYERGDRARASVQIRDDGYLVVLHVAPDGLVRVLFPLDPTDDNFVRGGKSYEIRGRGDREAFTVGGTPGTGTVYAAWSGQPFHFDDFARDGHWDYTVLGDSAIATDPETGLTNLVGRMATGHFDYDLTTYTVPQQVAYARRDYVVYPEWPYAPWAYPYSYDPFYDPYYGGGFFGVSLVFGRPYYYSPFYYRPFFGGCYYCGPRVYRPYAFARYPIGPYRWKGGVIGGGRVIGVAYRPRNGFVPNTYATAPGYRGAHLGSGPGVGMPWRTPSLAGRGTFGGRSLVRPVNEAGGRRVPVSVRMPNQSSRGERTVFAEPRRVNGEPMGRGIEPGSRAVPDRPRFEPSQRASEPSNRVNAPPTRVNEPPGRVNAPPTRVSEPPVRAVAPPTRVSEPRSNPTPAPRSEPSRRPQEMNSRPQARFDPPSRVESPRSESPRFEAPRAEAPRVEAPRAEPRMSSPRMSSPRMSAPRMSAPRGGGGGGFGGGHRGGGGGGGRHH